MQESIEAAEIGSTATFFSSVICRRFIFQTGLCQIGRRKPPCLEYDGWPFGHRSCRDTQKVVMSTQEVL